MPTNVRSNNQCNANNRQNTTPKKLNELYKIRLNNNRNPSKLYDQENIEQKNIQLKP